jgi:hypothetical protein
MDVNVNALNHETFESNYIFTFKTHTFNKVSNSQQQQKSNKIPVE